MNQDASELLCGLAAHTGKSVLCGRVNVWPRLALDICDTAQENSVRITSDSLPVPFLDKCGCCVLRKLTDAKVL